MAKGRWIKWLHRTGYVTTALMAAELLWFGGIIVSAKMRDHTRQVERIRETSYRAGPVQTPDYILPYLTMLPSLRALGPDSLRFVAYPELRQRIYMVALRLRPQAATAEGLIIIRDEPYQKPVVTTRHQFELSATDYHHLTSALDKKLDGAPGSDRMGTDGTDIAIERRRGSLVTSGSGNFIEPYRSSGELILSAIRPGLKNVLLPPVGHDWYPED